MIILFDFHSLLLRDENFEDSLLLLRKKKKMKKPRPRETK
jgi:hypothetical protein